ncbi:hypothetical protein [Tabrizicola caldifontis]|uniref:hypothetical protein n=1 Tax=Tabrizicola caldifontis TaxID=2528036 RepID=UPI001436BC70|nr:hypothetical protein [Rhodobacter sp. YIM 73028]
MKIALTLSALALSLTPALAYSGCPGKERQETAASCMPGYTWDAEKGTCIATPSS